MLSFDVLPKRIQNKIMPEPMSGCWLWLACVDRYGYGRCGGDDTKKTVLAHRYVYFKLTGQPELTETLDHLCRNRQCVNPAHLQQVSRSENTKRGNHGIRLLEKTHCPQGHPYSGENLILSRTKAGHQHRECRTCVNDYHRNLYHQKKGIKS